MRSLLVLHLSGIRLALATRMADRLDFAASLFVMLGIEMIPSLLTVLLYRNGLSFPGWTIHEAVLIQSVFMMAKGIAYPFFGGVVWNTAEMIREGTFELLLLKPRHPLLLCIAKTFDAEDLGKLFGGTALTIWCLAHVGLPNAWQMAAFVGLLLVSLVLFGASIVTMSSLLIVWVGNFRVYEIFDTIASLGQFPPVVLPKGLRKAAEAGLPILGLSVLPASALLGKSVEGWPWVALSSVMLLTLALVLWNHLLRRLSSAGG